MADSFGAITLPLGDSDPSLAYILSFLRAYLNENLQDGWSAVSPTGEPVHAALAHDPEVLEFNEADLPALYGCRESGVEERIADEWYTETTKITLRWVFPPAAPPAQRLRQPFAHALAKAVRMALEIGRTPAWIVPEDTDTRAAAEGSLLYDFVPAVRLRLVSWKRSALQIPVRSGDTTKRRAYPSVEMVVELVEKFDEDLAKFSEYGEDGGLDLTVNTWDHGIYA